MLLDQLRPRLIHSLLEWEGEQKSPGDGTDYAYAGREANQMPLILVIDHERKKSVACGYHQSLHKDVSAEWNGLGLELKAEDTEREDVQRRVDEAPQPCHRVAHGPEAKLPAILDGCKHCCDQD
jgi:hypothetical protein